MCLDWSHSHVKFSSIYRLRKSQRAKIRKNLSVKRINSNRKP